MAEHQVWLQHTPLPAPAPDTGTAWVRKAGVSDTVVALCAVLVLCSDRGGRWDEAHLLAAVDLTVPGRHHRPDHVAGAVLRVAGDPDADNPATVADSGHRPNRMPAPTGGCDAAGLAAVEAALDACDGLRPILQQRARDQLTAEGVRLTRAAVLYRAHTLLRQGAPQETPKHAPIAGAHTGRGPGGGW